MKFIMQKGKFSAKSSSNSENLKVFLLRVFSDVAKLFKKFPKIFIKFDDKENEFLENFCTLAIFRNFSLKFQRQEKKNFSILSHTFLVSTVFKL